MRSMLLQPPGLMPQRRAGGALMQRSVEQQGTPAIPNNLGPTLLLVLGAVLLPLLLGVPLLLLGLSRLRTSQGQPALPWLKLTGWWQLGRRPGRMDRFR